MCRFADEIVFKTEIIHKIFRIRKGSYCLKTPDGYTIYSVCRSRDLGARIGKPIFRKDMFEKSDVKHYYTYFIGIGNVLLSFYWMNVYQTLHEKNNRRIFIYQKGERGGCVTIF